MNTKTENNTGTVVLELDGASILNTNEIAGMKEDITVNRDDIAVLKSYIGLPPSEPLPDLVFTNDGKCYPPHMVMTEGVTSVGNSVYKGYEGIKSVKLADTITTISDFAFQDCAGLNKLELSRNLTFIGSSAFKGCKGLASVLFPPNVTWIGNNAFEDCAGLQGELKLPSGIQEIKGEAFKNCINITSVNFPDTLTILEGNSFRGTGLANIRFPAKLNSIKSGVVSFMPNLKEVYIEHGIKSIETNGFINCPLLTDIYLPNTITSVGAYVFRYSPLLQNITLEPGFDCENIFKYADLRLCSIETLVAMLEALADRSETTQRVFNLGTTALSKLTEEQKAIATNKNWVLE